MNNEIQPGFIYFNKNGIPLSAAASIENLVDPESASEGLSRHYVVAMTKINAFGATDCLVITSFRQRTQLGAPSRPLGVKFPQEHDWRHLLYLPIGKASIPAPSVTNPIFDPLQTFPSDFFKHSSYVFAASTTTIPNADLESTGAHLLPADFCRLQDLFCELFRNRIPPRAVPSPVSSSQESVGGGHSGAGNRGGQGSNDHSQTSPDPSGAPAPLDEGTAPKRPWSAVARGSSGAGGHDLDMYVGMMAGKRGRALAFAAEELD
ncbi:hypothetical protein BDK51DRAFT_39128 [Blyttiomyces helicus]|uniref:Uncharacterized protein n=1 Tax=Blyttiomyces helicus TaxID=388810 RepID=A0A4P9W4Y3_9FUNG|nr:hypothetical protein BDK51DRAFT_39128 [Blyttiomyces helicus]|eukprot:RKO85790.1 hypothetical protein BDK51DRAFT_39128 [Blyttiomyces helicus]